MNITSINSIIFLAAMNGGVGSAARPTAGSTAEPAQTSEPESDGSPLGFIPKMFGFGEPPVLVNGNEMSIEKRNSYIRARIEEIESTPDVVRFRDSKLEKHFELAQLYIALEEFDKAVENLDYIINFGGDVQRNRPLLYYDANFLKAAVFRIRGFETRQKGEFLKALTILNSVLNDRYSNIGFKARAYREIGQINFDMMICNMRTRDPGTLREVRREIQLQYEMSLALNMDILQPSDHGELEREIGARLRSSVFSEIRHFDPERVDYRTSRFEDFEVAKAFIALGDLFSFITEDENEGLTKTELENRLNYALEWYGLVLNSEIFSSDQFRFYRALAHTGAGNAYTRLAIVTGNDSYFDRAAENYRKALYLFETIRRLNEEHGNFLYFMWEERNGYFQNKLNFARMYMLRSDLAQTRARQLRCLSQASSLINGFMEDAEFVPLESTLAEARLLQAEIHYKMRTMDDMAAANSILEETLPVIDGRTNEWTYLREPALTHHYQLAVSLIATGDYELALEHLEKIKSEKKFLIEENPELYYNALFSESLIHMILGFSSQAVLTPVEGVGFRPDENRTREIFEKSVEILNSIINDGNAPEGIRVRAQRELGTIYYNMFLCGIHPNTGVELEDRIEGGRQRIEAAYLSAVRTVDGMEDPDEDSLRERALALIGLGNLNSTFRQIEVKGLGKPGETTVTNAALASLNTAITWYSKVLNDSRYSGDEFRTVRALALIGSGNSRIQIGKIRKSSDGIAGGIAQLDQATAILQEIRNEDEREFTSFLWEERNAYYRARVALADAYFERYRLSGTEADLTLAIDLISRGVLGEAANVPMSVTLREAKLVLADSYARSSDPDQVEEAIRIYEEVISEISSSIPINAYPAVMPFIVSERVSMAHLLLRAYNGQEYLYGRLYNNSGLRNQINIREVRNRSTCASRRSEAERSANEVRGILLER